MSRIKVEPVLGRGRETLGWAIYQGYEELDFFSTSSPDARIQALNRAHEIAKAEYLKELDRQDGEWYRRMNGLG